jgi:hypothetical protein
MSRRKRKTQYISICGHSAVGKKTLIAKLLDNGQADLRERFGLGGKIEAYGLCNQFQPLARIFEAQEDCIIHFWQDKSHPWIECLRRTFPNDRQRVILLWRPWDIHSKDLISRNNDYKPTATEVESHWHDHIVPLFRGIEQTGVEFELVNASTPNYDLMPWPRWDR